MFFTLANVVFARGVTDYENEVGFLVFSALFLSKI
jgi:hypothetical protein